MVFFGLFGFSQSPVSCINLTTGRKDELPRGWAVITGALGGAPAPLQGKPGVPRCLLSLGVLCCCRVCLGPEILP